MRSLYVWVDQDESGRLLIVFPKQTADDRREQAARLMNMAHLSTSALALNFAHADAETSPELRDLGQAAEAFARAVLEFQRRAREEIARRPIVPDEVIQ